MNKTKWAMAVLSFILVFVVAFLLIPPSIHVTASPGVLSLDIKVNTSQTIKTPPPNLRSTLNVAMDILTPMDVPTVDPGCATDGTYLYVLGGLQQSDTTYLDDIQRYDPDADTWTKMDDLITARWGLAAAYLDGKIWTFGGYKPGAYCTEVEYYDISSNTSYSGTALPYANRSMLAITVGSYIYLFYNDLAMGPPCYTYRFDPTGNGGAGSYTQLTSSAHSHGYGGAGYVQVGEEDRIYLLGGGEAPGVSTDHCEYYRIDENDYVGIDAAPDGRDGQVREQFTYDGKIYYGPGEDMALGPAWYDTFYVYDTATGTWNGTSVFTCDTTKDGVCGGVLNNILYVFGGRSSASNELSEAESFTIPEPSIENTPSSENLGVAWWNSTYYAKGNAPGNPVESGNCTFVIVNDGSITENVTASMADMTGNVTWSCVSGSPGANEFRMTMYYAGQDPASGVILTNAAQPFYNALAASANISWDFKYETGTWTNGDVAQRSGNLTLTAVAP